MNHWCICCSAENTCQNMWFLRLLETQLVERWYSSRYSKPTIAQATISQPKTYTEEVYWYMSQYWGSIIPTEDYRKRCFLHRECQSNWSTKQQIPKGSLDRCRNQGIALNPAKLKPRLEVVEFMGPNLNWRWYQICPWESSPFWTWLFLHLWKKCSDWTAS